jgi:uncharacterized protein (DUF362 family)
MRRRDFIKDVAAAGLALRFGPAALAGQAPGPASGPLLAVAEGESPAAITREAIAALGGMKTFVARGDKVVIKPNIGWDRTPEMAACTNPEVVRTLVELVLDAGAKKAVVIDNTTNQAKRCYVRSGIQEAVKQAGGDMLFVDDYRIKKMALNGAWLKDWEICLDVVESDKIINVPIAKHHSLTGVTLGMKNWYGLIGGNRNRLHQRIHESIVDLTAFAKPTLTVLDGYRVLMRSGPTGGSLADVEQKNTVVAGTDPVAIDAYAARAWWDLGLPRLRFLALGEQAGLGRVDFESLRTRIVQT